MMDARVSLIAALAYQRSSGDIMDRARVPLIMSMTKLIKCLNWILFNRASLSHSQFQLNK